jgi:hypothetical protein
MLKFPDLVGQTTTTTGTGALTLSGGSALEGLRLLSAAVSAGHAATGDRVPYILIPQQGGFESGIAQITVDGSTVTVTREVSASTNSNNAINLQAGTHSWRVSEVSGIRAEVERLTRTAVIAVLQEQGESLPSRPEADVVHWYSWDEPPSEGASIYDQWFEIPEPDEPAEPAEPDAFTAGQWSVADTTTGGTVAVTITALPDADPSITDIEYRVGAGDAVSFGESTTGTYNISGLTDDVEVDIQIRAVNSEGPGAWSDTKAVTPTESAEAVPEAFTVGQWSVADTEEGGEIAITITALPTANPSITDLEYRIDAGSAVSLSASTTGTYNVSGLTDDVEVDVQIRAVNGEGAGDWSDTKQVTPTEAAAPSQVYTDFGDQTTDAFPDDWTVTWSTDTTWRVRADGSSPGGKHLEGEQGSASGGTRNAIRWDEVPLSSTDMEILALTRTPVVSSGNLVIVAGRLSLGSGAAEANGYALILNGSDQIRLVKYVDGTFSGIGDAVAFDTSSALTWVRFRLNGTTLQCKAWLDGDSEPESWNITETDSSHAEGSVGFVTNRTTRLHEFHSIAVAFGGDTAVIPS